MDSGELTVGLVRGELVGCEGGHVSALGTNLCRCLRCISLKWTMSTKFHLAQQPTPHFEDCKVDICGYAESEVSRIRHDRGFLG